jgi:hypothetical protein
MAPRKEAAKPRTRAKAAEDKREGLHLTYDEAKRLISTLPYMSIEGDGAVATLLLLMYSMVYPADGASYAKPEDLYHLVSTELLSLTSALDALHKIMRRRLSAIEKGAAQ